MLIKVKTLTGKEIEIDIEPTDKVERIKERVEEKEGIPPAQQRLIFSGKQMNDDKPASEYKVTGGSVLHLVLALRGGGVAAKQTTRHLVSSIALTTLAACMTTLVLVVATNINEIKQMSVTDFRIPTTVGDAKRLSAIILKYKDDNFYSVFGAYFATYILLQSLCIPGSLVLSILAGYLFHWALALSIICFCSTLGASTFYILVDTFFRRHVTNILGKRIEHFRTKVHALIGRNNSNILVCVILLRATPIVPNWMINLCSPIVKLPLKPFVQGTFIGVAPLSIIHVWTGRVLNDLSNDESLVNKQTLIFTTLAGLVTVSLIYLRKNYT